MITYDIAALQNCRRERDRKFNWSEKVFEFSFSLKVWKAFCVEMNTLKRVSNLSFNERKKKETMVFIQGLKTNFKVQ